MCVDRRQSDFKTTANRVSDWELFQATLVLEIKVPLISYNDNVR